MQHFSRDGIDIAYVDEGEGPAVKEGANITVNYFGAVWGKGDDPFDSSFERGSPATFQLAKGQLIDGWVQGLAGVKEGSRVMLVIPADLGYGDAGQPPDIPGPVSPPRALRTSATSSACPGFPSVVLSVPLAQLARLVTPACPG